MSSSIHATNRGNNIYVMGKEFIQGINDTTIYAEKLFHNNFTELGEKFALSLHYNGDNSYLFANGRQQLKFKAKDDQIINEKLCIGTLSSEWSKSESEKTGLYGNIYDFVADYKPIVGVDPIYDMRRYLMIKHNITPKITPKIYKVWLINLAISLFSVLKVNSLECLSLINRKCMSRPKILDVNEGIGEALFYLYNVLVNKCSGSCNTLQNPMSKICVLKIIKNLNMQVYNSLMRLNETRNVLWQESCQCVCKLNSTVSNSKQIWNSDTCRCDCNEDFAGIINCTKGYTWNPSSCECQCDMWCKPSQYLDHKNCICRNKLIGRVIDNTYLILFIVFLIGFIVFLILFIYYCRSNANKKKLRDFIYPKVETLIYQIIKNGYKAIRNKKQN